MENWVKNCAENLVKNFAGFFRWVLYRNYSHKKIREVFHQVFHRALLGPKSNLFHDPKLGGNLGEKLGEQLGEKLGKKLWLVRVCFCSKIYPILDII